MSKEENRDIIDAYQQMLNDGTAFKEVDIGMLTEPDISEASGVATRDVIPEANPLGDKVETPERQYHNDYSEYDSVMEQRINRLRQKTSGRNTGTGTLERKGKSRLALLEKKVAQLEEALMLVMETHEQLLE